MSKEFKEGFSKGIGLTTGVLAIPVAGLLLFGAYKVLRNVAWTFLRSEEMYEYYDCSDRYLNNFYERNEARGKGIEEPPRAEKCERPTREWKWQPKEENK